MSAAPAGTGAPSGILLVDKPQGITSHDVVARVRRLAGTRKVGHAGTLDPMATGLLILGVGTATRLLTYIVGTDKRYEATIRLGAVTTTDDADGEVTVTAPAARLAEIGDEDARAAIDAFIGPIMQVPSSVSAIKVDGKRAYARVRAGEDVQLQARAVTVARFELLAVERVAAADGLATDALAAIDLRVSVECSSGTYIRALARDLGAALGVGGHLIALRRSRVGPFLVEDAAPLDALPVAERLLTPAAAAAALMPVITLSDAQAIDLGHGKRLSAGDLRAEQDGILTGGGPFAACAPDGRLVGLIEVLEKQTRVLVNFPAENARTENGAEL